MRALPPPSRPGKRPGFFFAFTLLSCSLATTTKQGERHVKVGEETTAKYRDAVLTHRIRVAKCAQFLESVETIDDKATAERLKLARMTARLLEHHLRHLDQRAHDLRELPDPNRPVQTSIALADAT